MRAGRVTGVVCSGESIVRGIAVDGETLDTDAVVIAMGPWSILAAHWIPLPAVFGQQSPSLVYDTGGEVPAHALFLEYVDESAAELTIEVFPRADGSTHVTAFSSQMPLPPEPAAVAPEPGAIARYRRSASGCRLPFVRTGSLRDRPASVPSPKTTCH